MKNLNIITMKKLIKTLLSLIAVFALVFSCTDLDEELQGQITTDISLEGIDTGESAGGGGDAFFVFVGIWENLCNSFKLSEVIL